MFFTDRPVVCVTVDIAKIKPLFFIFQTFCETENCFCDYLKFFVHLGIELWL